MTKAQAEKQKVVYLNEKAVGEPGTIPGCNGNTNNPVAEPGFLCVFQGDIATPGSLQSEWKEAKWFALQEPDGKLDATTENVASATGKAARIGALVTYRTNTFTEPQSTLATAATLNAGGSWALTVK
jgi:hypothetical protein